MNTAAELGLRVNWTNILILVGILMLLCGAAERILINVKPKEIGFWLINVILSALILGLILVTCNEMYDSKYIYDGGLF